MQGDSKVLVVLYSRTEPLLAMLDEVVVGQERHCQWDVGFGWCEVAIQEGFVDDVESPTAAWFFKVGGHAPDGVDFKVRVAAATQLFCCFKGGCCVFGKVAEECESVMLGGSVEVWFSEGVLSLVERDICGWPTWNRNVLCA